MSSIMPALRPVWRASGLLGSSRARNQETRGQPPGCRVFCMTLQEKIQAHITDAMRGKDSLRLNTLRMMKSAVKNKEIEKMKALEEGEVLSIFGTLVKQRKDSIEQFRKGG